MIELRHMRYFLAVAEELHFGRAAERLGIAQPPLSRQIRYLEHQVRAELFTRTSRKVELTQAGEMFLREALATLAQADRAQLVAARAQKGEIGELRVGLFPAAPLARPITASLIEFRNRFPEVHLSLKERAAHDALDEMAHDDLDICFLRYYNRPPVPEGTEVFEIFNERLIVLLYEGHPLADETGPIPLKDLKDESFVLYSSHLRNPLLMHVLRMCQRAGFEPRIEQEAEQNGTIVGLVAAGMGISILPPTICQMKLPSLRMRPLSEAPEATSSAWLAFKKDNRISAALAEIAARHRAA